MTLLAVVVVAVAVPVAVLALAGDDDGGGQATRPTAGPAATDPGSDADEQRRPRPSDDEGRRGNGKGGGKGPPDERGAAAEPAGPPRSYPTSRNLAYPNAVTQAGGEVARAVERELGAIAPSKGRQLTVLGADCRGGACSARYVSGPHGGGRMASDAAQIVRRVFARRSVRSLTLYAHEPRGRKAKGPEPMALMIVGCRRARHPRYRWTRITAGALSRRCRVREQSPGRAGSRIRKGRLSEHGASRGESGSGGGSGGGGRRGLKPPGTPAPRTVNPPKEKRKGDSGSGSAQPQEPAEGRGRDGR
jgi:hypothetical protein